jgi:hypothetical protein
MTCDAASEYRGTFTPEPMPISSTPAGVRHNPAAILH